jgi:zinc transport system substrate-binding protein
MWRSLAGLTLSLLMGLWPGLSFCGEDGAGGKINVFVGIEPIAYFVERVGGPLVEVSVLVGPGQDPHTFEPTPKLMAKLARAKVFFNLGFPFEETLVKKLGATFKNAEIVNMQKGIELRPVNEQDGDHHAVEEHGHAHEADALDRHTWLDPKLARIQAGTIADALIQIDPKNRELYEANLKKFQADLDRIHEQLKEALAPVKGKSFFVFHPAFGYFAHEYGLQQVAVEIDGKEPTARQLARLIKDAKKHDVRVIFVQPQFPKKNAENLAESIGGAVVPIDDLARDYVTNLAEIAKKLKSALQSQSR